MSTLQRIDGPGDAELISAVRGGDVSAYGELFERHVEAARRLARQLVAHGDVDDLVSDAFAKVLAVLQRGGGPDLAFRAYLLTAVRRLHVDKIRSTSRLTTTDDMEAFDPGVPFRDTAVEGFENAAAAKAFASLPERWQLVLWHTEVEGAKPADVAPLLGMSPNSVSALAYRAREGLRQAFLNMHVQELEEDSCKWTHQHVGAYVRNAVSKRDASKVEGHLDECRKCMAIYLELSEVNSNLSGILAPLLLGSAGAGYAAASAGVVTKGGIMLLLDRAKDAVAGNVPTAVAGSAAVVAVAAGGFLALNGAFGSQDKPSSADQDLGVVQTPGGDNPGGNPPTGGPGNRPGGNQPSGSQPGTVPVTGPSSTNTTAPTTAPTTEPTQPTTTDTTDGPTDPTSGPTHPTSGNAEPSTADDAADTEPNTPVTVDVTANDSDPDGDPLTVVAVTAPAHGTVRVHSDRTVARASGSGTITYAPDASWAGTDAVVYTISDGHGGTAKGTLRVSTANAAPTANDDTATTLRGTPVRVHVLANDTDPNIPGTDQALTPSLASQPSNGVATVNGDGTVTYTPDVAFRGTDSFTYRVRDGAGGTSMATVSVGVQNRAPVAVDDDATTGTNTPVSVDVLANDTDPDGDALSIEDFSATTTHGGTVTQSGDQLVYTPAKRFKGTDTFHYTVTDGIVVSDTATVTITVRNAAPVAIDDDATTDTNTPVSVDVLANDTDPDGDPLNIASFDATTPNGGTVTQSGDQLVYTPAKRFKGTDTFHYTVSDGDGGTDTATVSVTVGNAPPVANDDAVATEATAGGSTTIDVLANDTDPNGDALSIEDFSATTTHGGTVTQDGDQLVYTYSDDFAGVDTFSYTVSDGNGGTDEAVVTVTVNNSSPQAVDDTAETLTGQSVTIDALANDSDPNGDAISLISVNDPANGTAEINNAGRIVYTPDPKFHGTDTFDYTIVDTRGGKSTGTIKVAVRSDLSVTAHDGSGSLVEHQLFADITGIPQDERARLTVVVTGLVTANGSHPAGCTVDEDVPSLTTTWICGSVSGDADGAATVGAFRFHGILWRATFTVEVNDATDTFQLDSPGIP